jgi:hypothetical protein
MKTNKKANHGGHRENSGRPLKYGEETTNIAFRVPVSKVQVLRRMVNIQLNEWKQQPQTIKK